MDLKECQPAVIWANRFNNQENVDKGAREMAQQLSAYCSLRGLRFYSQHSHDSWWLTITLVLGDPMPLYGLHTGKTPTHIKWIKENVDQMGKKDASSWDWGMEGTILSDQNTACRWELWYTVPWAAAEIRARLHSASEAGALFCSTGNSVDSVLLWLLWKLTI